MGKDTLASDVEDDQEVEERRKLNHDHEPRPQHSALYREEENGQDVRTTIYLHEGC